MSLSYNAEVNFMLTNSIGVERVANLDESMMFDDPVRIVEELPNELTSEEEIATMKLANAQIELGIDHFDVDYTEECEDGSVEIRFRIEWQGPAVGVELIHTFLDKLARYLNTIIVAETSFDFDSTHCWHISYIDGSGDDFEPEIITPPEVTEAYTKEGR